MNTLPSPQMKYLDVSQVKATRTTEPPRYGQNSLGYGSKIPTVLQVRLADGRWRRVYIVQWSNSGTRYVVVGGEPHYIASGVPLG